MSHFRKPGLLALVCVLVAPLLPAAAQTGTPSGTTLYRSAFEGYRPHADPAPRPWREANDTVARIGGWQTYAREAQAASPAAGAASAVPADAAPSAPPSPSRHRGEGDAGGQGAHPHHHHPQ